jgi:peptidoglycan/LPS O-acetylase OafA/YrhL
MTASSVSRVVEPGPWGRVLLMLAGLAASLAAGWLAWRLVEVPAHRWILSRTEPRRPGLGPARSVAR